MFGETKRVNTCPYQLTIYGLLIIGLLKTIDSVIPCVFEQESVIVWTDYANLSPFLMTWKYFDSGTSPKKVFLE